MAIQSKTKEIYEVGERAKLMIGRTPQAYETIRPLKNGVIADYEITEKMLNSFIEEFPIDYYTIRGYHLRSGRNYTGRKKSRH
ncbi:Rod shape-determining protein MreB [Fusobacterium necrophorum subsp. necrophorum]|nr:Rod shape-determining protein MreB [Fusobacterium necrophorum subsp. necrophorum]